jgi:hypothetical protein
MMNRATAVASEVGSVRRLALDRAGVKDLGRSSVANN